MHDFIMMLFFAIIPAALFFIAAFVETVRGWFNNAPGRPRNPLCNFIATRSGYTWDDDVGLWFKSDTRTHIKTLTHDEIYVPWASSLGFVSVLFYVSPLIVLGLVMIAMGLYGLWQVLR